jgi:hypothetical protein
MTNLQPQPGFCAAVGNTARTRLVMLVIDDRDKHPATMNERFVAEFERGVEATGVGKRVSGRFIEIAGIKSYERLGRMRVNGKEGTSITRVVLADGALYSVQAMRFDGDASDDPEIREALASFRFIRAPSPPVRPVSAAYRIGYLTGILVPSVVLGGALVAIIVRARQATSSQARPIHPPKVPPPLPPHLHR